MGKIITSNEVKVILEDYNVESTIAMQEVEGVIGASIIVVR